MEATERYGNGCFSTKKSYVDRPKTGLFKNLKHFDGQNDSQAYPRAGFSKAGPAL